MRDEGSKDLHWNQGGDKGLGTFDQGIGSSQEYPRSGQGICGTQWLASNFIYAIESGCGANQQVLLFFAVAGSMLSLFLGTYRAFEVERALRGERVEPFLSMNLLGEVRDGQMFG